MRPQRFITVFTKIAMLSWFVAYFRLSELQLHLQKCKWWGPSHTLHRLLSNRRWFWSLQNVASGQSNPLHTADVCKSPVYAGVLAWVPSYSLSCAQQKLWLYSKGITSRQDKCREQTHAFSSDRHGDMRHRLRNGMNTELISMLSVAACDVVQAPLQGIYRTERNWLNSGSCKFGTQRHRHVNKV